MEDAEASTTARTSTAPVTGPAIQQLSMDGVFVPLVGGEWGEVKLLTIGPVEPAGSREAVRTTALSYVGRRAEAAGFAEAELGEAHRRGVETVGAVAAI